MSPFVESLKRLHGKGRISYEKLKQLKNENRISEAEFNYITKGGE